VIYTKHLNIQINLIIVMIKMENKYLKHDLKVMLLYLTESEDAFVDTTPIQVRKRDNKGRFIKW